MLPDTVSCSSNGSNGASSSGLPVTVDMIWPPTLPSPLRPASRARAMATALQGIITKRSLDCRAAGKGDRRSTRVPNWSDNGGVTTPSPDKQSPRTPGSSQRQHILSVALSLMAQSGVDGTSMRDLAAATGLNVASLYHYFPSKRDLLVAVLDVHGMVDNLAAAVPPSLAQDTALGLAALLTDILTSMLEVEDFIRLMLGE